MLLKDPNILLSLVNTRLRDAYPSLEDLCAALDIGQAELTEVLEPLGYRYDAGQNQFIPFDQNQKEV